MHVEMSSETAFGRWKNIHDHGFLELTNVVNSGLYGGNASILRFEVVVGMTDHPKVTLGQTFEIKFQMAYFGGKVTTKIGYLIFNPRDGYLTEVRSLDLSFTLRNWCRITYLS